MALLRRRKKAEANPEPRRSDPGNELPAATSPDQWRPKGVSQALPALKQSQQTSETWLPEGVVQAPPGERNARGRASMPSIPVPPEVRQDPPAAAASAPPAFAPAPASVPIEQGLDRDELHGRIASLEQQIDAAKAERSSEQDATIRALQLRLAAFEDQLQKSQPAYVRPAPPAATALRVLLLIAVFLVIAGSPLFMSRRSVCHVHGRPQTHWAVVKPFDDSGPPRCDNQLGGSVLVDSLGLK